MDIDAPPWRNIQYLPAQYLSVGNHNDSIGMQGLKLREEPLVFHLFWLIYLDIILLRQKLHRRRPEITTPPLCPVGLRYYSNNIIGALHQGPEGRDRKLRRPNKEHPHIDQC